MNTSRFFTQSILEQSNPMMKTMMNSTTSTFFKISPEDNMSMATLNRHSNRQFIDPVGADQDLFSTNCFKNKFKKFDCVKANN